MRKLRSFADKFSIVGEVRGKGLMIGIELVKDRTSKTPAKEALRCIDHPRVSQRAHFTVMRTEHGALHAAADDR